MCTVRAAMAGPGKNHSLSSRSAHHSSVAPRRVADIARSFRVRHGAPSRSPAKGKILATPGTGTAPRGPTIPALMAVARLGDYVEVPCAVANHMAVASATNASTSWHHMARWIVPGSATTLQAMRGGLFRRLVAAFSRVGVIPGNHGSSSAAQPPGGR